MFCRSHVHAAREGSQQKKMHIFRQAFGSRSNSTRTVAGSGEELVVLHRNFLCHVISLVRKVVVRSQEHLLQGCKALGPIKTIGCWLSSHKFLLLAGAEPGGCSSHLTILTYCCSREFDRSGWYKQNANYPWTHARKPLRVQ